MAPRPIVILGSTGSIGVSTLRVVDQYPHEFEVVGLVGGNNIERLAEQVRKYHPKVVATSTEEGKTRLRELLGATSHLEFLHGTAGAEAVARHTQAKYVVSAIVGSAGLRPTLAAIESGKVIALANKESLVVAGALVQREASKSGATILPVDSEHNAIFQALAGAKNESVRRLILTASGGPFFLKPEMNLSQVTPKEALQHPNWDMGPKITIDSATMMNKGLELIEAHWLFNFAPSQLDVVVHPQSIVHSMVEYVDGSVIAQMGVPDMRGPIAFALTYPDRLDQVVESLDFAKVRELTFFTPDHDRFPAIQLALQALSQGDTYPAVLNGANEISVQAFLEERIGFLDIPRVAQEVLSSYRETSSENLEAFMGADQWGRTQAEDVIRNQNRARS